MSLDPAVEDLLDDGDLVALDLIRIDVPGTTVGYHRGGRPFSYNGLVYKPNRYLDFGEANAALGVAVTTRTIVFSDIPTPDPDDAIAKLEEYEYTNAPVIVTHLAGRPNSNEVVGILYSTIYEIAEVRYLKGEQDADGRRSLTIEVDIEPPGRSARGATLVRRAQEEQQFDNDPDDTSLEYAALLEAETEEWGQAR